MGNLSSIVTQKEDHSAPQKGSGWAIRLPPRRFTLLLIVHGAVVVLLIWLFLNNAANAPGPSTSPGALIPASEEPATPTLTATHTQNPPTPTFTASPTPDLVDSSQLPDNPLNQGTILLSLNEGGYDRLFAYQPASRPLTRITNGPWDDITPSLSPDQKRIAFSSNRAGQWDLYILDLTTGDVVRLTDTPEYEAAPSLSPDGQYIAYEAYLEGNLEIIIRAIGNEMAPINLSKHPGADFAPNWSPRGRQIAFVSTRSGEPEIWLAHLDKGEEERFSNLSQRPRSSEGHPVWSPQGNALAWSSLEDGIHSLIVWQESGETRYAGSGDWPAWSPDGSMLFTVLEAPNQTLVAAHASRDLSMVLPPVKIPGKVAGLAWIDAQAPSPLPDPLGKAAGSTPAPLWLPELTPAGDVPGNRYRLVTLPEVEAPYPKLHDLVDESFQALRARAAAKAGWDLLAGLENAYVPLTAPLAPGLGNDWLYTGRAFAINPLPANAGWMVIVPEQFGAQRYWRVYLKARFQDGSLGRPLHSLPWDLNARYGGDQSAYEQGGAPLDSVPVGYWVDFTGLAAAHGWERLAALPNWQSAFPAARFNEFVLPDGLDWHSAMLELYPPEALVTPTVMLPPTQTPTPTPRWYRTPTPTNTATPVPTLTPLSPVHTVTLYPDS